MSAKWLLIVVLVLLDLWLAVLFVQQEYPHKPCDAYLHEHMPQDIPDRCKDWVLKEVMEKGN